MGKTLGGLVLVAAINAGIVALVNWLCTSFWPVVLAALILTGVSCLATGGILTMHCADAKKVRYWAASMITWVLVFPAMFFVLQWRNAVSLLLYGAIWYAVFAVVAVISIRQELCWKKEHGLDDPCPQCGREMRYVGQVSAGYTDAVGAGGYGTRTRSYERAYRCGKCGHERLGRG